MKAKYTLFRRGGMFYIQDGASGKQTSLRIRDETEAKKPAKRLQRGAMPAGAKLAPCPCLPDGQRPCLCGTHMATKLCTLVHKHLE